MTGSMTTSGPEAAHRPSWIPVCLAGLLLLLTSAALFGAFVPVVDCPSRGHRTIALVYGTCFRCGKERGPGQRMTLWRWWFWSPTAQERDKYEAENRPGDFLLDEERGSSDEKK